MGEALAEARIAYREGEIPIGAVIVGSGDDGSIIARAHNQVESSACATKHAEILALEQASRLLGTKWLHGCTMFVTLEPCAMCAGALILSRIDRICIAAADPKTGAAGSLYNILDDDRLNHRIEIVYDILGEESSELIKDFFRELRQKRIFRRNQ